MDDLTHIVEVTVTGQYPHGKQAEHAKVRIAGQGDWDHFREVFKAALVAAGFSAGFAAKLDAIRFD